jgi:hypothetical protein
MSNSKTILMAYFSGELSKDIAVKALKTGAKK